jgi:hypothetical protein
MDEYDFKESISIIRMNVDRIEKGRESSDLREQYFMEIMEHLKKIVEGEDWNLKWKDIFEKCPRLLPYKNKEE